MASGRSFGLGSAAEEFRVLKQSIDAREVQVFRGSWVADYNDPYTFLQLLESGFGINLPRYTSARYDSLLADARAETDPGRRALLLGQAEILLLHDAPVVPLFFYVGSLSAIAANPRVERVLFSDPVLLARAKSEAQPWAFKVFDGGDVHKNHFHADIKPPK